MGAEQHRERAVQHIAMRLLSAHKPQAEPTRPGAFPSDIATHHQINWQQNVTPTGWGLVPSAARSRRASSGSEPEGNGGRGHSVKAETAMSLSQRHEIGAWGPRTTYHISRFARARGARCFQNVVGEASGERTRSPPHKEAGESDRLSHWQSRVTMGIEPIASRPIS